MQTIKIKLDQVLGEQIDFIVKALQAGQVMAYPTDTVYGLGCDCRNAAAIKRIHKIKEEKNDKALLVLISDFKMLKKYCFISLEQLEYLKKVWSEPHLHPVKDIKFNEASLSLPTGQAGLVRRGASRPVTVILKRRPILPEELTGGLNSLAIRLPKNEFLIKIIEQAGFPLVSTSLNKKGEKALEQVDKLEGYFKYLPDLVIDAGPARRTKPSKLIDIRDVNNIKILRK